MPCLIDNIQCEDQFLQELIDGLEGARSFAQLIGIGWQFGLLIAVKLVQQVLAKRAEEKTQWLACPSWGKQPHSKGIVSRQLLPNGGHSIQTPCWTVPCSLQYWSNCTTG